MGSNLVPTCVHHTSSKLLHAFKDLLVTLALYGEVQNEPWSRRS